jgi:hypothetical protein
MWKNKVQPDRPQTIIRRMLIVCYRHTLRICNTYSFSMAIVAARTRLYSTLHVQCLACLTFISASARVPVTFPSKIFFGWFSTMTELGRSCWKQNRFVGRLKVQTYFKAYTLVLKVNVPIHNLVSIIADGAPAMTNENAGLIGLRKNTSSYHCVLHQQTLFFETDRF